jgi:hypothetical protein
MPFINAQVLNKIFRLGFVDYRAREALEKTEHRGIRDAAEHLINFGTFGLLN